MLNTDLKIICVFWIFTLVLLIAWSSVFVLRARARDSKGFTWSKRIALLVTMLAVIMPPNLIWYNTYPVSQRWSYHTTAIKQIATSIVIYMEDTDHTLPPMASWESAIQPKSKQKVPFVFELKGDKSGFGLNSSFPQDGNVNEPENFILLTETEIIRPNNLVKTKNDISNLYSTVAVAFIDRSAKCIPREPTRYILNDHDGPVDLRSSENQANIRRAQFSRPIYFNIVPDFCASSALIGLFYALAVSGSPDQERRNLRIWILCLIAFSIVYLLSFYRGFH